MGVWLHKNHIIRSCGEKGSRRREAGILKVNGSGWQGIPPGNLLKEENTSINPVKSYYMAVYFPKELSVLHKISL